MKNILGRHKNSLTWLSLLAVLILLRHAWIWLPQYRYSSIINKPQIVAAYSSNQPSKINSINSHYHLQYEKFVDGKFVAESDPLLPLVHLLVQNKSNSNVLYPRVPIAVEQPYTTWIAEQPWVYFPISSSVNSQNLYVVFTKVT